MAVDVDRRRFLTTVGVAGTATGAAWIAPSVLGGSSAFALTSSSACAYAGTLHWADATWASGGTTGDDSWVNGDLTSGIPGAPDNSSNGASTQFVAKVGGTGNSYVYVLVKITAVGPPAANSGNGGSTGGPSSTNLYGPDEYLILAKTASTNPETASGGYEVAFTFYSDDPVANPGASTVTVSNISFEIRDIDGTATSYYEQIWITGSATTASRTDSNTNITGAGTSSNDAWRNDTSTSNLAPPGGNITVGIPSTSTFTIHDQAVGSGKNLDHGWSIGEVTWGC